MTEYVIADEKVSIPTAVENERYVNVKTSGLIAQVGGMFEKWYGAQYDCNTVYKKADDIVYKAIMPIIEKGVEMLNSQGVYSIDEEIFADKYFPDGLSDFYSALEVMRSKINDIDKQNQLEKEYRQARKDGRGRVVGGGFGLGGALKGMAMAGAMNAVTGAAHSLGNTVGNMGSSIAASSSKSAVYKNSKEPLKDALIQAAYNARSAIRKALLREANIECKYVTSTESKQAEAIIQNYKQGRIPEKQKREQIVQALLLDPYEEDTYLLIWEDFGDKSGDLREMADYFECPLKEKIQQVAEKFGRTLFQKNCSDYKNAFNKRIAAVENEERIKTTLKQLEEYCVSHDIQKELIPEIKECEKLLRQIDRDVRTVHGVTYKTRKTASDVREDYVKFYTLLEGKNKFNDELRKNICEENYKTNEFKENLAELLQKEERYRNEENIFSSIYEIITKNLKKEIIEQGWIDCADLLGNMRMKEAMIRTIVPLQPKEVPLVLFDRSGKGKSGILLTNMMFREYSKGIFSNENKLFPLDNIYEFECVGIDEYVVSFVDYNEMKVSLKHKNISEEEQILLGETINKIIKLIKNLTIANREQIYRIVHSVATCSCGMHLIQGEVLCPGCGKMLRENGEFVETEICPVCKSILPKGKRFCSKCGNDLKPEKQSEDKELDNELPRDKIIENNEKVDDSVVEQTSTSDESCISCMQCKAKIPKGKKFCSVCGWAVEDEVRQEILDENKDRICPNCKNMIKQGKKFCSICGTKVE